MTPPLFTQRGNARFATLLAITLAGCSGTLAPPPGDGVRAPLASQTNSTRIELRPFDTGLPRSGQWRDQFAIGDVDRDGHPDIVLAPARKSFRPPAIFLGDGKGNWSRWKEARFPPLPYDYGGVAVGDFSTDGHPDLVLGFHLRGLAALRAGADGTFDDATNGLPLKRGSEPLLFSSRQVFLHDWQGDGRPDFVALSEGMAALQGGLLAFTTGPEGWHALARDEIAAGALLASPVFGRDCLAVARQAPSSGWSVHERCSGRWQTLVTPGLPEGASPTALAAGDLDRDGITDVALSYRLRKEGRWHTAIDVFLSKTGMPSRYTAVTGGLGEIVSALALGRPRGADVPDLAALGQNGQLTIYAIDKGIRRLTQLETPEWRGGCRGHGLELADLDNDGRDEIVASFAGEPSAFALPTEQCHQGGAVTAWKPVSVTP